MKVVLCRPFRRGYSMLKSHTRFIYSHTDYSFLQRKVCEGYLPTHRCFVNYSHLVRELHPSRPTSLSIFQITNGNPQSQQCRYLVAQSFLRRVTTSLVSWLPAKVAKRLSRLSLYVECIRLSFNYQPDDKHNLRFRFEFAHFGFVYSFLSFIIPLRDICNIERESVCVVYMIW